jgi:hypothetical protein
MSASGCGNSSRQFFHDRVVSWCHEAASYKWGGCSAVILNAVIHNRYYYAEGWPERSALIAEVMENLQFEQNDLPWIGSGEIASFMFADRRHSESVRDWWPDNTLQIAVNRQTGYGGLVWFATQERVKKDDTSAYIWVSNNVTPPEFDPRVVSDPGVPHFFDRRSVLPVSQIKVALEEFCWLGTGDRPECIEWVRGEMNGRRHD